MKNYLIGLLIGTALLLGTAPVVPATTLELVPSATTVNPGDTFDMALNITGIAPQGVTVIHTDLFFDSTVLSLAGATAGDFFDLNTGTGSAWFDPINPFPISTGFPVADFIMSPVTVPDMLGFDFMEFNFVPSIQDGTLVNLTFSAIGVGDAMFGLNDIMVIDASGAPSFEGIVTSDVSVVPEPGTIMLLGLGLISLAGWRRRRRHIFPSTD